ncbi:hypothetical protein OG250_42870 [Streptomyces sp. NBC_00487]|nr:MULTISPECIES: hypothetical protein [unclassified Streptomyces]
MSRQRAVCRQYPYAAPGGQPEARPTADTEQLLPAGKTVWAECAL